MISKINYRNSPVGPVSHRCCRFQFVSIALRSKHKTRWSGCLFNVLPEHNGYGFGENLWPSRCTNICQQIVGNGSVSARKMRFLLFVAIFRVKRTRQVTRPRSERVIAKCAANLTMQSGKGLIYFFVRGDVRGVFE